MNRIFIFSLLFLFSFTSIFSQKKFISDTAIIDVPVDSAISKIEASLISITDNRTEGEEVLRITQKNIYNYIPVDLYINTNKPVADYISELFDDSSNGQYNFTIDRFEISTRKGLIYPALTLNALINVTKYSDNNRDTLKGTLIYSDEINSRTRGKDPGQKEKKLLKKWENNFVSDMQQITEYNNDNHPLPYNFRASNQTYRTNLMVSSRFAGGFDYWMIEGEVVFAEPEARKKFRQSGYMFRYRNEKKFESIAFTRNSEHFLFRVNNKLLLDVNTNFMIGVNKWKDMWEEEHPIWHIVLLDLSVSQYLLYTPFSSEPSFIIGGGLLENAYYVPDGMFKFRPGLGIQIGYRF